MVDTTNRKSVPLPSILEMEPKKARRAWAVWMASTDLDIGGPLYVQAESVRFSIDMVILNLGDGVAEDWARRNLEQEFAKFKELAR